MYVCVCVCMYVVVHLNKINHHLKTCVCSFLFFIPPKEKGTFPFQPRVIWDCELSLSTVSYFWIYLSIYLYICLYLFMRLYNHRESWVSEQAWDKRMLDGWTSDIFICTVPCVLSSIVCLSFLSYILAIIVQSLYRLSSVSISVHALWQAPSTKHGTSESIILSSANQNSQYHIS